VETVKKVSPSDFHLLTINFCYRNSLYIKLFTPYIGYGANNTHIEQVYLWAHIHIFPGNLCYGPISQLNSWIPTLTQNFQIFYNTDRAVGCAAQPEPWCGGRAAVLWAVPGALARPTAPRATAYNHLLDLSLQVVSRSVCFLPLHRPFLDR
jgi:hypothetical protein